MKKNPYHCEHSARIFNPKLFTRFFRKNNAGGKGVDFVFGVTPSKHAGIQAIRFKTKYFTPAKAKAWLKKHKAKVIKFETARGE